MTSPSLPDCIPEWPCVIPASDCKNTGATWTRRPECAYSGPLRSHFGPSIGLTCLSLRTQAGEGGHTVNAGGPWCAGGKGTVIDVLAAVIPAPAVHTHAAVASVTVGAGASILTSIGL